MAYLRLWVLSDNTIGISTQYNKHVELDHGLSVHVAHISLADARFVFAFF